MADEIEPLRSEDPALHADRRGAPTDGSPRTTRRHLLRGVAGIGAAGVAGVATATSASAEDGGAMTLGEINEATVTTALVHDAVEDGPALTVRSSSTPAMFVTTDSGAAPLGPIDRAILAVTSSSDASPPRTIEAITDDGYAIVGENDSAGFPTIVGVNAGSGAGVVGGSHGHGPQLVLFQEGNSPSGPPTTWAEAGSLRYDGAGDLWLCRSTGEPAVWTRLLREDNTAGRTIPIQPIRVMDSREPNGRPGLSPVIPGQRQGPLKGGSDFVLDIAGFASPIPANAAGLVGNLTVVSATYAGYLSVKPGFTGTISSAINFVKGVTVANAFTSRINAAGLGIKASGTASNTFHLVVDITAYIT